MLQVLREVVPTALCRSEIGKPYTNGVIISRINWLGSHAKHRFHLLKSHFCALQIKLRILPDAEGELELPNVEGELHGIGGYIHIVHDNYFLFLLLLFWRLRLRRR